METLELLDARRLQLFAMVAREGGFSRASRRLGRTQSSVSQAVSQLETRLGTRLFVREGRGARLTSSGRMLLEHTERLVQEGIRFREQLEAEATLKTGRLTVGTSDTLACYLLPPLLAAFRRRFPAVELRLENRPSPLTARRVAEGALDAAVISGPLPTDPALEARLRFEPLVWSREVLICPKDHALASRRRVSLETLGRHPLLLLDRTTGGRAFLDAALARRKVTPHLAMEMSSVEVLKRLVELGFGLSVVPELSVERERKVGTLAVATVEGLLERRPVGLVLPVREGTSAAARAFAELARHELRPLRRDGPR